MNLDTISPNIIKNQVQGIANKYLPKGKYRVFFFGSRVAGTPMHRSDIDIGILGDQAVPGHIMVDIKEALENLPTLYSFDLVDFTTVSDEFKRIALSDTEPIL